MTSHRSPSQHSGGWALGSRPTFFLVGHAALLRGPITAPQSAGHSAPRFGHASSIGSQVPTSFRTAVRLPTNDLSCTLFVPAPPCSLTHCPNLASPRSSSSASTSLGGQLGCLCTACMVCFASRPALQFQAQLRALQAFAQISPQPFPRTALHGPAQHGNMAGASTALQALLQGQRADRIQAFRSLGAQRIVQLESELAEARMTLFGPLPAAAAARGHSTARHLRPDSQATSTAAPACAAHTAAGKDPRATRGYAAPLCNADAQTPQRSHPAPPRSDTAPPHWPMGAPALRGLMPTKMSGMSSATQRQHQAQHRAQPWKGKGKGKAEWEHMQGPGWGPHGQPYAPWGGPAPRPAIVGLPTAPATARPAPPRTARHRGVPARAHRSALGKQPQRRSTALLHGSRHCQMRRQM